MIDAPPAEGPRDRDARAMAQRTRALAAPARDPAIATRGRLLVFTRAGERFGVALDRVAAVVTVGAVTPVPGADAPVRGIVAWRGRPVAVYDLAAAAAALSAPVPVVIVGDWRHAVGLLADVVEDAVDDATDVAAAPRADAASSPLAALIRGVTGDATAVVDADAVLSLFARRRTPPSGAAP